jgi:LysM repeat protein
MRVLIRFVVIILISAIALAPVSLARADGGTHVVQSGETLFRIALNHGVTVEALRTANGIAGNTIYAGQVLKIPGAAPETAPEPVPVPTETPAPPEPLPVPADGIHIVQRGENLYRISVRYGVTVQQLLVANGLRATVIYVGQRLTIPGASTAAPAEAAPAPVAPAGPPAGSGKRFLVDLSEQMLYAYEGDSLVRSTLISSGLWPTTTVTGTYYVYLRYTSQRMRGPGYDLPGVPYVMYFYKGYARHGTYWHSTFGNPLSHGCVNMPTSEAEWAFNWSTIGTPVVVQY